MTINKLTHVAREYFAIQARKVNLCLQRGNWQIKNFNDLLLMKNHHSLDRKFNDLRVEFYGI